MGGTVSHSLGPAAWSASSDVGGETQYPRVRSRLGWDIFLYCNTKLIEILIMKSISVTLKYPALSHLPF